MCRDAEIDMAVQVNGKLRGTIHVEADSPDSVVIAAAQAEEKVSRFLEKQTISWLIELCGMFGVEKADFSMRKLMGLLVAIAGVVRGQP